jgi:hypothetical protein
MHLNRFASNPRWWISLVAATSLCLWASNILPIQQVDYRLSTSVAVSQNRLAGLHRLKGHSLGCDKCPSVHFVIQQVAFSQTPLSHSSHSDLCSAQITLVMPHRQDHQYLEAALETLTVPSATSNESRDLVKQIRKEAWLQEALCHSLKRCELDIEREKETQNIVSAAQLEQSIAGTESSTIETTKSRFQLSSFVSRKSNQSDAELVLDSLRQQSRQQEEKMESLQSSLKRLMDQDRGYLAFTGSQTVSPKVLSITVFRLVVLGIVFLICWGLLGLWADPSIAGQVSSAPVATVLISTRPDASRTSDSYAKKLSSSLRWLELSGIPYLGAAQVMDSSNHLEHSSNKKSSATRPSHTDESRGRSSVSLLRRLGNGSMLLWLILFAARLVFDPQWRELAVAAPFAAIARLIVGVY